MTDLMTARARAGAPLARVHRALTDAGELRREPAAVRRVERLAQRCRRTAALPRDQRLASDLADSVLTAAPETVDPDIPSG